AGLVLQDAGLYVQGLGRDPQALGDLLEDLGARLAEPALDLAEVGVGDARGLRELTERDLRLLPLLADVLPDRVHRYLRHNPSISDSACYCKRTASASKHPGVSGGGWGPRPRALV